MSPWEALPEAPAGEAPTFEAPKLWRQVEAPSSRPPRVRSTLARPARPFNFRDLLARRERQVLTEMLDLALAARPLIEDALKNQAARDSARREREQERARFLARRGHGAHLHFDAPEGRVRAASAVSDVDVEASGGEVVVVGVVEVHGDRDPRAYEEGNDGFVEQSHAHRADGPGLGVFAGDKQDVDRDGVRDVRDVEAGDSDARHGSSPSVGRAAGGTSRVSGPPAAAATAPGDGVPTVGDGSGTAAVPPSAAVSECFRCAGCGQVADSADREPWSFWESLPPQSRLAVTLGLVRPVPCPECEGTGRSAS